MINIIPYDPSAYADPSVSFQFSLLLASRHLTPGESASSLSAIMVMTPQIITAMPASPARNCRRTVTWCETLPPPREKGPLSLLVVRYTMIWTAPTTMPMDPVKIPYQDHQTSPILHSLTVLRDAPSAIRAGIMTNPTGRLKSLIRISATKAKAPVPELARGKHHTY